MRSEQLIRVLAFSAAIITFPSALQAQDESPQGQPGSYGPEDDFYVEDGFEASNADEASSEEVDIEYFYDELSPYGEWFWTQRYGWVWQPAGLAHDWRPFTYGHWEYSEYGWIWVSSFPWGWAAFHYGSWAYLDYVGWVWVPGSVWSPARVIWRYSGVYVGWAPIIAGYNYWYGWTFYPVFFNHWTFITWHFFCHHHPRPHFLPHHRIRDIFHHTHYPRQCLYSAGPGCHHGPSHKKVAKKIGTNVPRMKGRPKLLPHQKKPIKAGLPRKNVQKIQGTRPRTPLSPRNKIHLPQKLKPMTWEKKTKSPRRYVSPIQRPDRPVSNRPVHTLKPGATIKPRYPSRFKPGEVRPRPSTVLHQRKRATGQPAAPKVRPPGHSGKPAVQYRPKAHTPKSAPTRHKAPKFNAPKFKAPKAAKPPKQSFSPRPSRSHTTSRPSSPKIHSSPSRPSAPRTKHRR